MRLNFDHIGAQIFSPALYSKAKGVPTEFLEYFAWIYLIFIEERSGESDFMKEISYIFSHERRDKPILSGASLRTLSSLQTPGKNVCFSLHGKPSEASCKLCRKASVHFQGLLLKIHQET